MCGGHYDDDYERWLIKLQIRERVRKEWRAKLNEIKTNE